MPSDTYVRRYADTLRVVRLHAAEMDRAAVTRDAGHEAQAWLRERGAERALSTHTRGLREQHGAKLAAEWIDRARGEAGL